MLDLDPPRARPAAASTDPSQAAVGDAALVAPAVRDRRAFAPLYARYAEPVYRYCYRRLGTKEAAEDATSVVFTKALAALPTFRGGSFAAWLFTIAHNVVVNATRRRPDLPLDAAGGYGDPSSDGSPEETALVADDRGLLRAMLAALPDDQRRVVELRLAGLTGAEIAETLGRSIASIKMLQLRALKQLRSAHEHAMSEGEDR